LDDKERDIRGRNGAKHLTKWREANPWGSRLSHGYCSQHFKERFSDLRTVEGKGLRAAINDLVSDLGGPENLTAGQNILLARIREKLIVLAGIGKYVDRLPEMVTEGGDLPPVLRGPYASYSESLRRDLLTLYDLVDRRPSKVPDLDAYIAGKVD